MVYSLSIIKGRNLAGKIGLFPQSYTAPAPPSNGASSSDSDVDPTDTNARTVLQPLSEESESESPPEYKLNIHAPVPQAPPNSAFLSGNVVEDGDDEGEPEPNGHRRGFSNGSGEMMKATITDVQKAIEQLGRGRGPNEDGDGDGERSFSFASSRDDQETDTDYDMSDMDGVDADGGQGWHKGARRKLAAKARKAVEEAEKLEAMMGGMGMSDAERRTVAPPIEVEFSDESEDEDGHSNVFQREHPHIPEEDEEALLGKELPSEHGTPKRASAGTHSAHDLTRDSSEAQTVTATRSSFPAVPSPAFPFTEASTVQTPEPATTEKATAEKVAAERAISPRPVSSPPITPVQVERAASASSPEPKHTRANSPLREAITGLPSPTGSFQWISANPNLNPTGLSKHSSFSSSKAPASNSALSQPPVTASSMQNTLVEEKKEKEKEKSHPSEWSVEDVVDWLNGKGFDQDVQDKFIGA
jgi:hypothetical protein